MADIGWARTSGEFAAQRGLRRGEWYKVVEDEGTGWLLLDVNDVQVRVTRDHLQVRSDPPRTWSVVQLSPKEAAVEAKKHGHPMDAAHGALFVCPGCRSRHHFGGRPKEIACPKCGKTWPVDWSDCP